MKRMFFALFACCSLMPAVYGQEAVLSSPSTVPASQAATVYHSGWAVLNADGDLDGQVVTVGSNGGSTPQADASVILLSPTSSMNLTTDEHGHFSFPNVKPGVYEIRSAASDSYASFGLQVLPHHPEAANQLSVYAASMPPAMVDEVLRSLNVPQTAPAASQRRNFAPVGSPNWPLVQSQRVALTNGVVNGRLAFTVGYGLPQSHTVKLFRDGQVIDTAAVDPMGYFTVRPEGAGAYSLIVGGVGHGALGIEVVDQSAQLSSNTSGSKLVSNNSNALVQDSLVFPVAMPETAPLAQQPPVEEFVGPPPVGGGFPAPGGGGFAGGGGAGGGGLGGLGGAGGLLGIAGLAVGVAALASDDDGFNGNLATPIQ